MLIAEPHGEADTGFRIVDSFSRIVRLGEGISSSDRLGDAAVTRTLGALKVCARKMRGHGVARSRSVATAACRRAKNGGEFLDRVLAETGIALEAITADEEARLTLNGCAPLLDPGYPNALVFDIGGGSTELMWIANHGAGPQLVDMLSLPTGVVSLFERYGPEPVPPQAFDDIVAWLDPQLEPFDARHGISGEVARGGVQMLGTSGTVTTLAGVHLELPRYDRSKVDGVDVDFTSCENVSARLAAMDYEERCRHPCIQRGRADLVVMGCAILAAICRRWPVGTLRVADRGIREGILLFLMAPPAAAGAAS